MAGIATYAAGAVRRGVAFVRELEENMRASAVLSCGVGAPFGGSRLIPKAYLDEQGQVHLPSGQVMTTAGNQIGSLTINEVVHGVNVSTIYKPATGELRTVIGDGGPNG